MPRPVEQTAIVECLRVVKNRIRTLSIEADSMRNQKLGLMQDLLTGKVPVNVDVPEMETA